MIMLVNDVAALLSLHEVAAVGHVARSCLCVFASVVVD